MRIGLCFPVFLLARASAFHDRFIIIDDSDFYHFGTSFNKHLGNRGFMFSRIEEPEIIDSLRQKFTQEWDTAGVEVQYPDL